MVGNRLSQNLLRPRCRASSHMWGLPSSCIRRVIALATTSRGARSASSCWPCMKRVPAQSTRKAPSPRTASEISGCCPRESEPSHITVGWNCTNSRSRSTAPARSASAMPSPVDDRGVRGLGEHLAEAAGRRARPPGTGRRRRRRAAPRPSRAGSPRRRRRRRPGAGRRASACSVTPISGEACDRGHQRPLDLRAGRVTTRVRDPVAMMAALAGQRQLAAGRVVEVGRPARSARGPPRGPR